MNGTQNVGAPAPSGSAAGAAGAAGAAVFIYYRIRAADEAAVRQRVADFQAGLCGRLAGLRAGLLRRHDDLSQGPLLTLMETYGFESVGDGDRRGGLAELLDAIRDAATSIEPLIQGERHVEAFEPCV